MGEVIDKAELLVLENDADSLDSLLSNSSLSGPEAELIKAASLVAHAKYNEVLALSFAAPLVQGLYDEITEEVLAAFEKRLTDYLSTDLVKGDAEIHRHQFGVLLIANWTGPSLTTPPKELPEELKKKLIKSLDRDGETAYVKMLFPQLFIYAKSCLVDNASELDNLRSVSWWNARTLFVHQRVLSGRVPSIKSALEKQFSLVSRNYGGLDDSINPDDESDKVRDLSARANLEQGLVLDYYRDIKNAKQYFEHAQKWTGMSVQMIGALGRRTRFQTFDTAQLVLVAESRRHWGSHNTDDPNAKPEEKAAEVTRSVKNEEPLLLEKPLLVDPIDEKKMRAVDQAILIALCLDVKNSNAQHKLTTEQMMPYVRRVLTHSNNWMIHTTGLWIRSRLESDSSKTVDRAAMQLQALVDQWEDETAAAEVRLKYIFDLPFPVLWQLKKEVGERFMNLGAAATALQIFEELEMWEHVIMCYRVMEKLTKAEEVVLERLKVAPTPELWCVLGDLKSNPEHYIKAWELSDKKYARAMRSLGRYYLTQQNYEKCVECLTTALDINPLFPASWFSLGAAAMRCAKWEDALHAFSRVVSLEPEDGDAWANMASIFIMQKKKNEAFIALQEALKQNRDSWKMWQNFLVVCMDIGEFSQALHAMHNLLTLKEKEVDIPILRMLTQVVLKDIPDKYGEGGQKQQKAVTELLGRVTSQISTSPDIWGIYANFHGGLGNKDKELDCLQKKVRYTETAGWESDQAKFEKVAQANLELADACLASKDSKNIQKQNHDVYSTKLKLRSLSKKTESTFGTTPIHKQLVEKLQETEALEASLQQK